MADYQVGRENPVTREVANGKVNGDVYVSPGDDLQSRVDEAPKGGRLIFEPGDHKPEDMGTAVIDKVLRVIFTGGGISTTNPGGARIENTGPNAVDGPILTFTDNDSGVRQFGSTLIDPLARHEGAGEVISIETPMTQIHNPFIRAQNGGERAITSTGDGWGTQIYGGRLAGGSDYTVYDDAIGGIKMIYGTQVVNSGGLGMRAGREWQINCDFGNCTTGLELHGGGTEVWGARFENNDLCMRVGDSQTVTNVSDYTIGACEFRAYTDYAIEFDECRHFTAYPHTLVTDGSSTGEVFKWTANSQHVTQMLRLEDRGISYTDNGNNNTLQFAGSPRISGALSITNPKRGMQLFCETDGEPIFFDGSNWVLQSDPSTLSTDQY